jgi:hypothetical protein
VVTFGPQFQLAGNPVRVLVSEQRAAISVARRSAEASARKNEIKMILIMEY